MITLRLWNTRFLTLFLMTSLLAQPLAAPQAQAAMSCQKECKNVYDLLAKGKSGGKCGCSANDSEQYECAEWVNLVYPQSGPLCLAHASSESAQSAQKNGAKWLTWAAAGCAATCAAGVIASATTWGTNHKAIFKAADKACAVIAAAAFVGDQIEGQKFGDATKSLLASVGPITGAYMAGQQISSMLGKPDVFKKAISKAYDKFGMSCLISIPLTAYALHKNKQAKEIKKLNKEICSDVVKARQGEKSAVVCDGSGTYCDPIQNPGCENEPCPSGKSKVRTIVGGKVVFICDEDGDGIPDDQDPDASCQSGFKRVRNGTVNGVPFYQCVPADGSSTPQAPDYQGGGTGSQSDGSADSAGHQGAGDSNSDSLGGAAAALGGPEGVLLNEIERSGLPSELTRMGLDPEEIGTRLDQGEDPASIVRGAMGSPAGGGSSPGLGGGGPMSDAIKALEQDFKDGKLDELLGSSSGGGASSGGAGAKKEAEPDFGSLFGRKSGSDSSGYGLLKMNGERGPASGSDSDIWHTGSKHSIFQIVSNRIDKSREKIHVLEWASPLNRALMGLPSKRRVPASSKGLDKGVR